MHQAKQTKVPVRPHSTCLATQPYQGLSINFCFTGISSKDSNQKSNYRVINGKTCCILVTDHFTDIKHGVHKSQKGHLSNGLPTSLLNITLSAKASMFIWTKVNSSTILKFKIFSRRKAMTFSPLELITPTKTAQLSQDIALLLQTLYVPCLLVGTNLDTNFWPYAHQMLLTSSAQDRQPVPPDIAELNASNFAFDVVPFVPIFTGWLKCSDSPNNNAFGL